MHPLPRLLAVVTALAAAVAAAGPASVAAPPAGTVTASTTAAPPAAPVLVDAKAYVDGVRVRWYRGKVTTSTPDPVSYLVTRSGAGDDVVVSVDAHSLSSLTYEDRKAPVGEAVTYTVTAVGPSGSSVPVGPTEPVVRPAWDGPFENARTALVAVWDAADDSVPADVRSPGAALDSILLSGGEVRDVVNGSRVYGSDWMHSMHPVEVGDGTYDVGTGEGRLPLQVRAGEWCIDPTGTATVARTAYAFDGLASQTVDAELDCANGHHLSLAFRWRTPDPFSLLRMSRTVATTVAPGRSGSVVVTVRQEGSAPVDVAGARLVGLSGGESGALSVTTSTCPGRSLAAGASCTVEVAYSPSSDTTRESRAVVVLDTAGGVFETGVVVGQPEGAGQPAPTAVSSPRGLRLTWQRAPSVSQALVSAFRVEHRAPTGVVPVATVVRSVAENSWVHDVGVVPTGGYDYRVVLVTTDGRELVSPWTTARVPESWLVLATTNGAVTANPDDGWSVGGTFGSPWTPPHLRPMAMAADPRRASILTTVGDGFAGEITRLTPTSERAGLERHDAARMVADVSPDGSQALVVRPLTHEGTAVSDPGAVLVLDDSTSTFTEVPNSAGLHSPRWLPDGSAFLAVVGGTRIERIDPASGKRSLVLRDANIGDLTVSRQGRMAFVRSDGWHDHDLVETSLTGKGRRLVASYSNPIVLRYDPTGRYLFVGASAWTEGEASRVYDLAPATPALVATLPIASDAAWWDPVSSSPTATVSVPAWTTRAPTVSISPRDPDDAVGGLALRCRVDGGPWAPCASAWRPGTLSAGDHRVEVEVTDPAGRVGSAGAAWRVDGAAPTASVRSLPLATLGGSVKLSWTASDTGGSGLRDYDVRYRRAPLGSGFGSWVRARTGWSSRSTSLTVAQGYQYCFSTRARDVAGNVGAWSAQRCTTVARDDRGLRAGSGWTRAAASSALHGTVTRASRGGVVLSRAGVSGRRVGLVATTCAACGSVDVYIGKTKVARLSLTSSTTRARQVRWSKPLPSTRSGTLTIRTTSARKVVVDGFLVSH